MQKKSIIGTTATLVGMGCAVAFTMGCDFDPLKYASRNACEFVNCDVLFFVEDIFPLSAGPQAGAAAAPVEEDAGGH